MRFDLPALARRAKNPRRRTATLRDIVPPAILASNLFAAGYAPVIALWQSTAERVTAEYERSLSALTTDAPSDLSNILDEAEAELTRLLLVLRPAMRSWTILTERWFRSKWVGAVLAASSVDLSTLIGPEDVRETLETVLERNVGLVKDVSSQARQRISTAVFDGLRNRTPARDVGKAIAEATGMARRRAKNVAADQLQKTTSALASERRRAAGIDTYEYMHSGKLHPRSWHKARNGKLYSENADRVGTSVEGKVVNAQLPADDRAGIPPFCACRERAVLIFD